MQGTNQIFGYLFTCNKYVAQKRVEATARVCQLVLQDCSGLNSTPQIHVYLGSQSAGLRRSSKLRRGTIRVGPKPNAGTIFLPTFTTFCVSFLQPMHRMWSATLPVYEQGALVGTSCGDSRESITRSKYDSICTHRAREGTAGVQPMPTAAEQQQTRLKTTGQGGSDTETRSKVVLAGDLAAGKQALGTTAPCRRSGPRKKRFPWPRVGTWLSRLERSRVLGTLRQKLFLPQRGGHLLTQQSLNVNSWIRFIESS